MNGIRVGVIFLMIFFVSCDRKYIRENNEGEALFVLYRSVPQRIVSQVSFWKTVSDYITQEQRHIPNDKQKLLQMFDDNYAVVRFGNFAHAYKVDKITYQDSGNKLEVSLTNGNVNDMGYPVFVQRKSIRQIIIVTNNIQIYSTNLP